VPLQGAFPPTPVCFPMQLKQCRSCGVEKPLSEFNKDKNRKDGHYPYCKACTAIRRSKKRYYKKWRETNPEKVKEYRRTGLLRRYGLTEEDYNELLEQQNYACAICKSTDPKDRWDRFHVDHCHETNIVRGLLCTQCNTGLGKFYDNTETLSEAIRYLNAFKK